MSTCVKVLKFLKMPKNGTVVAVSAGQSTFSNLLERIQRAISKVNNTYWMLHQKWYGVNIS